MNYFDDRTDLEVRDELDAQHDEHWREHDKRSDKHPALTCPTGGAAHTGHAPSSHALRGPATPLVGHVNTGRDIHRMARDERAARARLYPVGEVIALPRRVPVTPLPPEAA